MDDIGGVWRTIGGRRVFIKTGHTLHQAMVESGKFKRLKKKEDNKNKVISEEEYNKIAKEDQEKYDRYVQNYKKQEENLNKLLKEGKITSEEYDKKWLANLNVFQEKTEETMHPRIYDSKKEEVYLLKKDKDILNEGKQYKGGISSNYTDEEKNAITAYTSSYGYGSSSEINTYLNGKENYLREENKIRMKNNIDNIDKAMSKSKIGGEYQFYRGVEPDKLGYPEIADAIEKINRGAQKGRMISLKKQTDILAQIKGKEIETKGYMSTSMTPDPNYMKRGVTLVINSKADDRAIDISSLSKYNGKRDTQYLPFYTGNVQTESEVLYDRDTKLKVTDYAVTKSGVFLFCDTEQKRKK